MTNLNIIIANISLLKPLLTSIQLSLIDLSLLKITNFYQLSTLIDSSKYSNKLLNKIR